MPENNPLVTYTLEVAAQLKSGYAGEHGYRPALAALMSSFEDVSATNDPRRTEHGNPDMVFYKTSNHNIILGRAEAKDISINLDKTAKTEQLRRYAGYEKLFLTNGIDFLFYQNGEEYERISIGKLKDLGIEFNESEFDRLLRELKAFLTLKPEKIKSGKKLALIMGGKARRIRDNVSIYLGQEDEERNQELEKIFNMMKVLLVHDLTPEKFADMYAQTLVYGLFVARYNDRTSESFTRSEARDLVPKSNPFLQRFFDHIVGPDFDSRLSHIVDELCEVFSISDVHLLVQKHLRLFEVENEKDPIIHFYEDFLKEYDPLERKRMGAYYTPVPVVRFIVRQVDEILKKEFGLAKGLADTSKITKDFNVGQKVNVRNLKTGRMERTDTIQKEYHRVQILDPAVGTATFLNETIKHIYKDFENQKGRWPSYVEQDLLPRLHGFELMMAPYTIAHLKLGMTLQETGVENFDQRLGVYLTNTLEEGIKRQQDLFSFGLAEVVSHEAEVAAEIKHEKPIMIIIGNPPYSGESSNKTEYASSLISKYKFEPGGQQKLQERNPKWLNDDYVKFIAFAEDIIIKNGEGIMAMITNHAYLDNPTFRGMRWHLAHTFDQLYSLDLHGSTKKGEKTLTGGKDENVFDIQQGVAILIGVKTKRKAANEVAQVFAADMYGLRNYKFKQLSEPINWNAVKVDPKKFYFSIKTGEGKADYERGTAVNELFISNSVGIVTARDHLSVQFTKEQVKDVVNDMQALPSEELRHKYDLGKDVRDWTVDGAKQDVIKNRGYLISLAYRPLDKRFTYYTGHSRGFHCYPRNNLMNNFLEKENLGLMLCRQQKTDGFYHALIHKDIVESSYVSNKTSEIGYSFPLYIYREDGTYAPNFKPEILKQFTVSLKNAFEPEDILDYIYAVLYSPHYREKYKEFLKTDFPRVPAPKNDTEFEKLTALGRQLRGLHLMTSPLLDDLSTTYLVPGSDQVEKIRYEDEKVWINDTQYFGSVPEIAWKFYIGGYQPAQKWLKDRKGRKLTNQDIEHYQKIIKILSETNKLMQKIDQAWKF